MTASHRTGLACFAASIALHAATTSAQTPAPALMATRRDTIQQALAARDAGDHARALDLAQRAAQIASSPSLRAIIAREAVALTRWSLALGEAQQCVVEAERDVSIADREQVLAACRRVVGEAQGRVGRLTVQMPQGLPAGVRVRLAGADLPSAAWGLPYVVTPGSIEVEVSAPERETFRRTLTVAEGGREEVAVTLAERPQAPPPPLVVAQPVVVQSPPRLPTRQPPPVPPPSGPGPGPWIVAGVGVASLALGGVFYGLSQSAYTATATNCSAPTGCSDWDSYNTMLTASNVTLGIGAVAVVGGAAWWIIARVTPRSVPRTALLPTVTPGGAGLGLSGSF